MSVKIFLTGWILATVVFYPRGAVLAGFCSASNCNLSNVSVIPEVTLSLSPESVVYAKIGSDRIVIVKFSTEINLKNLNDVLSVRNVDITRLDEQLHLAKKEY